MLPDSWAVLGWTLLAGPLALGVLLWAGSTLNPPLHPDHFFTPEHLGHGSCLPVQIPDGDDEMPGLLLKPPLPSPSFEEGSRTGVVLIHGAGDTKISFKWRLVQALLAEGLLVLTIDLPGHGDYRRRPLAYPDCLSAIPAAIQFLRSQPGVERVGLVGISLGSAMAIRSLAEKSDLTGLKNLSGLTSTQVDALVALETPTEVKYSRTLRYREMWNAYRAPVLSLWREMTIKQMRQSWHTGGYVSRHKNTAEVISLLNPLSAIAQLSDIPILLVHGERDIIAPPTMGLALRRAAPQATLLTIKKASHVTLTLIPEVNRQVAKWLRERLEDSR
jgi:pimeloyl-ACP methyl ester carboxylesterase